jgi:UDP-glucose 4-epimerase
MRIVLTGSSGRLGRALFAARVGRHKVVGIDRTPFATTRLVGDFTRGDLLERALDGADAVIHTAALHAPHVGLVDDGEFRRVNVDGTARLADRARAAGCRVLVFTSTTALYGAAVEPGACTWIDEDVVPEPTTIYHRTKCEAEAILQRAASEDRLAVRILRMSRSFPEPAPLMAAYRIHRGIDIRDAAEAHVAALDRRGAAFKRFVLSAPTPFTRDDTTELGVNAPPVLRRRVPHLVSAFERRGWPLPPRIDRVYAPHRAASALGWTARHGFAEVLAQLDRRSLEVLPPNSGVTRKS